MKTTKIFANVTNSIGELDVLLPLFSKLNAIGQYKFVVHLTSREFISKFDESDFYKYCVKELNINLIKFDLLPIRKQKKNLFDKFLNRFLYSINLIRMTRYYCGVDIFIHDYTSHRLILSPIYLIAKLSASKIYAIPHGLGVQIDTAIIDKADIIGNVTMLIFDQETKEFHQKFGYKNMINIGYVKLYKEWISLLRKYKNSDSEGKYRKIVILSRHVHELYMDYDKYIYLLKSFLEYSKKFYKDHEILIKIHPRESVELITEIANQCQIKVKIIRDHPAIACIDASLVISFWTSAIIDAAAVEVPAIEYYKEAINFRLSEPCGSVFKKIGFMSASNIQSLTAIINNINEHFDATKFYSNFYNRVNKNMPDDADLLHYF
jgi:hypothetical protein